MSADIPGEYEDGERVREVPDGLMDIKAREAHGLLRGGDGVYGAGLENMS
jgi:non-ribosomal peptide synthetase component E (peptide arylation enzyme)